NTLRQGSSYRLSDVLYAVEQNYQSKFIAQNKAIEAIKFEYESKLSQQNQAIETLRKQIVVLTDQIQMLTNSKPWRIYSWLGDLKRKILIEAKHKDFAGNIQKGIKLVKQNPDLIKIFYQNLTSKGFLETFRKTWRYMNRLNSQAEYDLNQRLVIYDIDNYETIEFRPVTNPKVSIVIPVFNKFDYTYKCLKAIYEHTNLDDIEIIIADDASEDYTRNIEDYIKGIKVVRNQKSLGFLRNCNNASKHANGEFICFLNNDTQVQENWLKYMIDIFENEKDVGIVCSKIVFPDGTLQEAGSIIWSDGSTLGYGRGDDPDKPEYNYVRDVDYGSGVSLLIRKALFEEVGGFDDIYAPAYYEDADLCLSIRQKGYRILYQPKSVVVHYEHGSHTKENAVKLMLKNRENFYNKWKEVLSKKLNPNTNNILNAISSINPQKRILVIDDCIPATYLGSGFPRMNNMVKFLSQLGLKVTFYPMTNPNVYEPYLTELQQMGIEVFYGRYAGLQYFKEFAQNRKGFYDIVLISRPHNMEFSYDIIKKYFKNSILLYDAEALFSMREILKANIKGNRLTEVEVVNLINKEVDLIKSADIIITVSEKEASLVHEYAKIDKNKVFVFSHPAEVVPTKKDFEERSGILFVGSFLTEGSPNEDAVLYFVKEIYPKVFQHTNAKLYIVGTNYLDSINRLSGDNVIVTGKVENLDEFFNTCRLFIVPHRFAAGIPIKLIEAMSRGIPAVVSHLIASQLNINEDIALIAKDPESFAEKTVELYNNKDLWYKLRENEIEFVRKNFSPEILRTQLKLILDNALALNNTYYSVANE
ncbi:MAG: hypothetical protein C0172_02180, partial [Caldisphaera sp.]